MTPAVSVILPTLNRARLLPRAMASVLRQSHADLELVIVDDGSTDDTRAVVESFADNRVVYLRNEAPAGDAAARNRGLAQARGEWLAFQDSDDEWVPHKLAAQLRLAGQLGRGATGLGHAVMRVTQRTVSTVRWPLRAHTGDWAEVDADRLLGTFCAYLQGLLVRRDAAAALGGFDENLKARSDFDFCWCLASRYGFYAAHEILALSYESGDGISGRPEYRRQDIAAVLHKHGARITAEPSVHARYLYDLARAHLECNQRLACLGTGLRALTRSPAQLRTWGLLAVSPFGAPGLRFAARVRQQAAGRRE
jgi:glycosyltransferase involved in cell wall biosynthesis